MRPAGQAGLRGRTAAQAVAAGSARAESSASDGGLSAAFPLPLARRINRATAPPWRYLWESRVAKGVRLAMADRLGQASTPRPCDKKNRRTRRGAAAAVSVCQGQRAGTGRAKQIAGSKGSGLRSRAG